MLLYVDSNVASPYALVAYVGLLEKGLTFDIKPLEIFANAQKESTFDYANHQWRRPSVQRWISHPRPPLTEY